ncbi:hypothetical protein BCF11_5269 [Collimonas sp. PA-H2]|uniref:hypothetical protein n=1 Tax=Collimonas sp. PA-H2 TaxID=1881062 RepID=UPI000BF97B65|nr:hypothetical protein [Collimonas sp. PA-H2]PFH04486.1 hypothetical protein BCF11_5269 [Collimonas sp. PA-H2]
MRISSDFGIVIRREALKEKAVNLSQILIEFHFDRYFDESKNFISLGPFFGGDAADDCMRSLEKIGLIYIDDFFIFVGDFPQWCRFEAFLSEG